ncbi:hypothetical protein ACMFMG_001103 [Clarireedia jacksonii]
MLDQWIEYLRGLQEMPWSGRSSRHVESEPPAPPSGYIDYVANGLRVVEPTPETSTYSMVITRELHGKDYLLNMVGQMVLGLVSFESQNRGSKRKIKGLIRWSESSFTLTRTTEKTRQ